MANTTNAMVDIPLRGPPRLKKDLQREAKKRGYTASYLMRVMLQDSLRRLRDGEELTAVVKIAGKDGKRK